MTRRAPRPTYRLTTARNGLAALAGATLVLATLARPGPARAFELDGCTLSLRATSAAGEVVSEAAGPGSGGTVDNPFVIDPGGRIDFSGATNATVTNHEWQVSVYGFPIASGSFPNPEGLREESGTVALAGLPAERLPGLYFVSGYLVGEGGGCRGSGWVRVAGDAVGSPAWLIGTALLIVGVLLGVRARPRWEPAGPEAERPRVI